MNDQSVMNEGGGSPVPRTVDEAQRKDRIAEAAVPVFADHGFSETTVQEIADEAGVSKGSIYLYFESKRAIFFHVFRNFEAALDEAFDRALSGPGDADRKLDQLTADLLTLVKSNRPTIKMLFDFWSHSLHSDEEDPIDFEAFYNRRRRKIERLLREGARDGLFPEQWEDALPSVMIGMVEGQLIQWLVDPSTPRLEALTDCLRELIMNGLRTDEARRERSTETDKTRRNDRQDSD